MTTLRFRRAIPVAIPDPLRPAWCEPDETAAVGVIELRPHARQHETTGGHRVVLPALLTLALVAGEATVDVEAGHHGAAYGGTWGPPLPSVWAIVP